MVHIPSICYGFPRVSWHPAGKMEWCFNGMSLTLTKLVQWRQVHCAAKESIMFSDNDHAMAPLSRLVVWHFFQYAHGLITDEVVVNLFLPVKKYGGRDMASHRFNLWINVDLYRRSSFIMKRAMWAIVEGICLKRRYWTYLSKSHSRILTLFSICTKTLVTKEAAVQRSAGGRHKCD